MSNCPVLSQEFKVPLTFERVAAEAGSWARQRLEAIRQERHHEVLATMLPEVYSADEPWSQDDRYITRCVDLARKFADLAYPPPKEQP